MNEVSITDEQHTVEYHADWNAYGIQLDEAPQLDNPSSLSIVESGTGGITFTEVPRTQAPSSGQYRVDYDAPTYFGTGRIEFNASDNGKTVLVSYKGGGWIVKNQYRAFQTYLLADLHVTEDADIDGDLNVDGVSTFNGAVSALGGISGNLTGDVTGDVTGNADTATQADNATTADGINETGSGGGVLHFKILEIGPFNMNGSRSVDVLHGLDSTKIRYINAIIRKDPGETGPTLASIFARGNEGAWCGTTYVRCYSTEGGVFDSSVFNYITDNYNRGWIIIGYID